jgi:hypothetical protein
MSDYTNSAAYKRYQSIMDLPDNGSKEMAKAKEVAKNKLGELATSHMAKQMGIEDPFAKVTKTTGGGGGTGGGGAADMPPGFMPGKKGGSGPIEYKKGGKVEKESKSESKKEMAMDKKQDVAMIKKAFKQHDAQEHKGSKGTTLKLKKGGSVRGCGIASKGLTKGKIV